MEKFLIKGNKKISGQIEVSKSKNAYLPILAAVLLNKNKVVLKKIPKLQDIELMFSLLRKLGVKIEEIGSRDFSFDASKITSFKATYELVKK